MTATQRFGTYQASCGGRTARRSQKRRSQRRGPLSGSAEFRAFAGGSSSPVTHWLRALARLAHAECGGPGVGAIGMCFTGGFALAMMLEPVVLAPVLSQPALPLDDPAGVDMTVAELASVRERMDRDDLTVMAYRFEGDLFCRAERFEASAEALGDRFVARVLPDAAANRDVPSFFSRRLFGRAATSAGV